MKQAVVLTFCIIHLCGCQSTPIKDDTPTTTAEGKIIMQPTEASIVVKDLRPPHEKFSRIEKYNSYEAKLIGDSDFTSSPLNLIASHISQVISQSKSTHLEIISLRIRLLDDDAPSAIDPSVTDDYALGVGGLVAVPLFRLFNTLGEPDSYLVEVSIKAKYKGIQYVSEDIQVATHKDYIPDTILNTIRYASILLGKKLPRAS